MKFFLDSAKIDEISYAIDYWGIDGVTSNPRHIKTSGKPFLKAVEDLAKVAQGTSLSVSVEVNPHHDNAEAMVEEGTKLYKIAPANFVVKLPCTDPGFKALRLFKAQNIPCNLTLCFNPVQAIQAARLGAKYISPFIGWKEENGEDVWPFIEDIVSAYDAADYDTEVLVAAVRNGGQIARAAALGADIVTCGFDVYKLAFQHPYTPEGLKRFADAWDATPYA
jgi:transaldolase